MTTFNKPVLLAELQDRIVLIQNNLPVFFQLSNEELNFKPAPDKWSIAEVFEHLNITHGIYLASIEKKLKGEVKILLLNTKAVGWAIGYMKKLCPRQMVQFLKMKAPKFLHAPFKQLDGKDVLKYFNEQLDDIHDVLEQAASLNIEKIKIPLSFTTLLSLRLGDILRFLIAHSERHLLQAQKVAKQLPKIQLAKAI